MQNFAFSLITVANKLDCEFLDEKQKNEFSETTITGLSISSAEIKKGDLFIALKGRNSHGIEYIDDAITLGAVAVAIDIDENLEIPKNINVPIIVGRNLREKVGFVSAWFYKKPFEHLKLIEVTGTNGKTTICYFIYSAIRQELGGGALLGTIENKINDFAIESHRTTLEAPELQKTFVKMLNENVRAATIEVSSQAISEHRIDGTVADVAIFTNLSPEHLNYHGTVEKYFLAKRKLFNREFTKRAIICIDDEWGERLLSDIKSKNQIDVISFASNKNKNADYILRDNNNSFDIVAKDGSFVSASVILGGHFNKVNASLAILACKMIGLKYPQNAIAEVRNIPGRFEIIKSNPKVIIDYAHTPAAIKEILTSVRETSIGRIITVTGAGGERDYKNRHAIANICYDYSDILVITDDNYRRENPNDIRKELLNAINDKTVADKNAKKLVFEVAGRGKGIHKAIENATYNDTVVVLGKGHEQFQIQGTEYVPYNDKQEALKALEI